MHAKLLPLQQGPLAEALLRDPDKLRLILDAADMPINYCSADRILLFVNKAYAQWYNRKPEDIIGKSIVELLGEEGERTIRPYCDRVLKGEHFRYETEVNLSIGHRYIQCSYTPVAGEKGKITGWVGIIYDLTQRYTLEKALHEKEKALILAKEKAEAASIAKSEFLANMSHEIRTPMNAVVGLSQILKMSKPLTSKQEEMINTLQLSAQSLLALINDLLDISKIESNMIDLEDMPFSLASIVDEVLLMFKDDAQKKSILLHYQRSSRDEVQYKGDPLRIRQILTNLIGNAVKFTQHGGVHIAISTSACSEPNHVYVHISVKDTGIGIARDKLAVVFDKFMQADMSITRQFGGSGLGLAICKNLAELMGGSITLESEIDKGSEFIVHLPLEYAYDAMEETTSKGAHALSAIMHEKNIHVLLAEDHEPNILVATALLESLGYRCDVARSGREVLDKIDKAGSYYDIILMDVQMPELDGYVTTRLLREEEKKTGARKIPIIGMTAHVMRENIEQCFESGMNDYIAKPYRADDLEQKILNLTAPSSTNKQQFDI